MYNALQLHVFAQYTCYLCVCAHSPPHLLLHVPLSPHVSSEGTIAMTTPSPQTPASATATTANGANVAGGVQMRVSDQTVTSTPLSAGSSVPVPVPVPATSLVTLRSVQARTAQVESLLSTQVASVGTLTRMLEELHHRASALEAENTELRQKHAQLGQENAELRHHNEELCRHNGDLIAALDVSVQKHIPLSQEPTSGSKRRRLQAPAFVPAPVVAGDEDDTMQMQMQMQTQIQAETRHAPDTDVFLSHTVDDVDTREAVLALMSASRAPQGISSHLPHSSEQDLPIAAAPSSPPIGPASFTPLLTTPTRGPPTPPRPAFASTFATFANAGPSPARLGYLPRPTHSGASPARLPLLSMIPSATSATSATSTSHGGNGQAIGAVGGSPPFVRRVTLSVPLSTAATATAH